MLGFEGTSLPCDLGRFLRDGLAGVAIYPRNYESAAGLHKLTTNIRKAAAQPVLIGIDQEGGSRFALRAPFTQWPSPAELGRIQNVDLAAEFVEKMARAIARESRAVGVNVDFAPMLDLSTNPKSPVTHDRSFGSDAARVARWGVAFLNGLAAEGVLGCVKHFPGHGDASVDPHLDLPRFDGSPEEIAERELQPFSAAIKAGAALVMTAHILLPRLDPDHPASMSEKILGGFLRRKLDFNGVILADDLGMGAIARRYGRGDSAVATLEAGTDIAMLCHDWSAVEPAMKAVARAIANSQFDAERWAAGRTRIADLRQRIAAAELPAPPLDVVGCAEHVALSAEISNQVKLQS